MLIGWTQGEDSYARYFTAAVLAARLVNPIAFISRPLLPSYNEAVSSGSSRVFTFLWTLSMLYVAMLVLSVTLAYFFGAPLLARLFPSLFWAGEYQTAVSIACTVSSSIVIGILFPIYTVHGLQRFYMGVNVATALLTLVAGGLVSLPFGYKGMLIVSGLFSIVQCFLLLLFILHPFSKIPGSSKLS
jgi:hypothetical protein